jgi:peptide/nickel transport system ATP-binding protein/oligopeptide transport system ATP-binding protein
MPILEVKNLRTHFYTKRGIVKAVDGLDVALNQGDTLGIVGESGCGKTVLALSIMRLVATPPGRIVSGEISFNGIDLLRIPEAEMRSLRGREISMIFQEPMTSLNPVLRVGDQLAEVITLHQHLSKKDALDLAVEMLKRVGLPSFEKRIRDYPHQMSGGMRQRVMIAMALSCSPRLMLADEPTTALDVTIQAQIMELITTLKKETGISIIIITHDLGVIAESAQFVAVMYAGRIVEYAPASDIFSLPLHPYTKGLMNSIPSIDRDYGRDDYLEVIPGAVPALNNLPAGCPFHDRCSWVMDACLVNEPVLKEKSPGHMVRCWKY